MDKAEKEKNPAMSLYWVHHLKTIINTCIHLNLMFFATRTNFVKYKVLTHSYFKRVFTALKRFESITGNVHMN